MSDATPTPAPAKKSGMLKSLAIGVVAIIAIVGGLAKTYRGISAMMGWDGSKEFQALIAESDDASLAAVKQVEIGEPLADGLIAAAQAQPLADVRLEQQENGRQAIDAFKQASQQFELASKKVEAALAAYSGLNEESSTAFTARARGFHLFAEMCARIAEICAAVLNEEISSEDDVAAKVAELIKQRDAAQTEANAELAKWQAFADKANGASGNENKTEK